MPDWTFTMPDGSQYDATSDTWQEGHKAVLDHAAKQQYEEAPATSKARMLIGDPLQQVTHGMTAGLFDKAFDWATGKSSAADTALAAARMGPTATGLARAGGAVMLPSAAPAAVARVGGGPLARTLTGAGTAGVEGGLYGGINAATGGESIPAGILAGGLGGAAGQTIAQGISTGVNAATKAAKGIVDTAPKYNMTVLPKNPSPLDLVNVAAAKAEAKGARKDSIEATQQAQKDEFDKLLTGKNKKLFTKSERGMMQDIVESDVGTKTEKTLGRYMGKSLVAGGLGAGVGASTGGLIPGVLTAGALLGGGKALTVDAAKATQEAVDRLRAAMYGKVPFRGPLSPGLQRKIGQGLGYYDRSELEDYLK